jgi:hypothetical protein
LGKGDRTTGIDGSGKLQLPFNPRDFQPPLLGWHANFVLDRDSGIVLPRTAIAEATIATLGINDAKRVPARKFQIDAGLIG